MVSKIIKTNLPCPKCGSSDARRLYEEGTSFCFSCSTHFSKGRIEEDGFLTDPKKEYTPHMKETSVAGIKEYAIRGIKERGITKPVCEFFNVRVSYDSSGNIDTHYYPYNGETGYKCRKLPKSFTWAGTAAPDSLFGQEQFNGGGKRLVIVEGELDALSVAQAYMDKYKKIYPVVSVTSANGTKALLDNRDWIRSFQEVTLCFDMDEKGEEATQKAIKIIGIDKVKLWKLPSGRKDASDVLVKDGHDRLLQYIWDAATWSPAGIVKKEELWKALSKLNDIESVPYPPCLGGINGKIKGMRVGEIALFISGTGSGKSTMLREVILHLLSTTQTKVGVISLEESPAETARKLSGMAINRNPANEEISIEDLKVGFDSVFGSDRILLLDHQGSIKDDSIVSQMEYMCLMGCEYIFVDHITILVSEGSEGLTGNEAHDKVMNDLLRLVKKFPVWVGLVSHLRKAQSGKKSFEEGRLPSIDDIRGSGSIKQISFDIIAFARNLMAESETDRNTIKMAVLKSRHTGLTGVVKGACYSIETGRLTAVDTFMDDDLGDI